VSDAIDAFSPASFLIGLAAGFVLGWDVIRSRTVDRPGVTADIRSDPPTKGGTP
jgi:hypothetical protein